MAIDLHFPKRFAFAQRIERWLHPHAPPAPTQTPLERIQHMFDQIERSSRRDH